MHLSRRKNRIKIAAFLLLAITTRSFVASGWMLQFPTTEDPGLPSLAMCPQQTPALRDWLTDRSRPHDNHGEHHEGSLSETLSVLDPTCSVWTGSAVASTAGDEPRSTPSTTVIPSLSLTGVSLSKHRCDRHRPRAPPTLG